LEKETEGGIRLGVSLLKSGGIADGRAWIGGSYDVRNVQGEEEDGEAEMTLKG